MDMVKKQEVSDDYLKALVSDKVSIAVYLIKGIKLEGQLIGFDKDAIFLNTDKLLMIFKHAITTIQVLDKNTKKK